MNTRTLKIEATGDFWRGKVVPKVRLTGQWLERAGFKPGQRVEVVLAQPGVLTLRLVEPRPAVLSIPASLAELPAPSSPRDAMRLHAQRLGRELLESAKPMTP
jgi:hypothetical protein